MNVNSQIAVPNFFQLLSFPQSYDINLADLKQRYRELQRENHPDQFSSSPESEKLQAVKISSLLNDAYEVLIDPVKRAKYFLELHGVDIKKDRYIKPNILLEQLSLREAFEEIVEGHDEQDKEQKLDVMQSDLDELFMGSEKEFSELAQADLDDENVLQSLKQILSRMLFVKKLMIELDKALDELD